MDGHMVHIAAMSIQFKFSLRKSERERENRGNLSVLDIIIRKSVSIIQLI